MNESLLNEDMAAFQAKIMLDPLVNKVIDSQNKNGWYGSRFHGYDSMESGIRILIEKGVSPKQISLVRALDALERDTELISNDLGSFGKYFDQKRLGGARMIRAWLLALGDRGENPLVEEQVLVALEGMKTVAELSSNIYATEKYHDRLIYIPDLQWPGIYHLRLLASTQKWRTPQNMEMVAISINKLVQYSPMPYAYVRKGSQLIAPASFAMLDFNPDLLKLDDAGWMMWIHRTELITRMGVAHKIKEISQQINTLIELLSGSKQLFTLPIKHEYFKRWGAYTGLMLEPDWKNKVSRINDLTFRSQIIFHQYQSHMELKI